MTAKPDLKFLNAEHLSKLDSDSERLSTLAQIWSDIDRACTEHFASASGDTMTENNLLEFETAQQEILSKMSALQTGNVTDAAQKLEVWLSASCIDVSDTDYLLPLEKLVVSVLQDLRKFSETH